MFGRPLLRPAVPPGRGRPRPRTPRRRAPRPRSIVIVVIVLSVSAVAEAQDAPAFLPDSRTSTTTPPAPALQPGPERVLLRGPQVSLRLQGGVGAGALPGSGPVLGLSGALRIAPVRYALHGRLRFSRDAALPEGGGRFASVDLWTVGARVCPELPLFSAWFAVGCVGAEGGRFRAEEPQRSSISEMWAGAFISVALQGEIAPPFALWVGSDLGVSLVGAEYSPDEAGMVSTGPVFLALELGVEVRLD